MMRRVWRKNVLTAAVLAILLAGGGCMMPHAGHGNSGQGHGQAAVERKSDATETSTGEASDRPDAGGEKSALSTLATHHGLVDPHSPWTWLAGGGMALMMLIMLL